MFLIDGFSDPYRCCIAEKTGRRFDIGGCGGSQPTMSNAETSSNSGSGSLILAMG
jgi:hypothetical protein